LLAIYSSLTSHQHRKCKDKKIEHEKELKQDTSGLGLATL